MKLFALAAFAAAIAAPASTIAGTPQRSATEVPTLAQWTKTQEVGLGRKLEIVALPSGQTSMPSGLVAIRFKCSPAGRPTAIVFSQKSQSPELNEITRRTVASLRHMHPLPTGMAENQVFEVLINVASSTGSSSRQLAEYRVTHPIRGRSAEVFALSVTPSSTRAS